MSEDFERLDRAFAFALDSTRSGMGYDLDDLLEELALLASNVGLEVVGRFVQRRERPDPAYFLGRGKALEMFSRALEERVGVFICDDRLTPGQVRNLKELYLSLLPQRFRPLSRVRITDRAGVIMEIFESRAHTAEAKLQVELARLKYELPFARGYGLQMSRTGGGIGTRGPGEQETERVRRAIYRRIRQLEERLERVREQRKLRRARRSEGAFQLSLVGYTNSGKSTLLSALSGDRSVYVEDKLFATLDPLSRRVFLPGLRGAVVVSDTVGFIRKLPPFLVAAFRATLEELQYADLLLHVVDVSRPDYLELVSAVEEVLREVGVADKPVVLLLNKVDLVGPSDVESARARFRGAGYEDVLPISAKMGWGLDVLTSRVAEILSSTVAR